MNKRSLKLIYKEQIKRLEDQEISTLQELIEITSNLFNININLNKIRIFNSNEAEIKTSVELIQNFAFNELSTCKFIVFVEQISFEELINIEECDSIEYPKDKNEVEIKRSDSCEISEYIHDDKFEVNEKEVMIRADFARKDF